MEHDSNTHTETVSIKFEYSGPALIPIMVGFLLFGKLVTPVNKEGVTTLLDAVRSSDDGLAILSLLARSEAIKATFSVMDETDPRSASDVNSLVAYGLNEFLAEVGGTHGLRAKVKQHKKHRRDENLSAVASVPAFRIERGVQGSGDPLPGQPADAGEGKGGSIKVIPVGADGSLPQDALDGLPEELANFLRGAAKAAREGADKEEAASATKH